MSSTDFRESVAYLVRVAFRGFRQDMHAAVRSAGVTLQEWYVLRALDEHRPVSQRELAILASSFESNLVAALRTLEARGYVTKIRLPGDRRHVRITLTESGRAMREVLLAKSAAVNVAALRGIPVEEAAAFRETIARIIENMNEGET